MVSTIGRPGGAFARWGTGAPCCAAVNRQRSVGGVPSTGASGRAAGGGPSGAMSIGAGGAVGRLAACADRGVVHLSVGAIAPRNRGICVPGQGERRHPSGEGRPRTLHECTNSQASPSYSCIRGPIRGRPLPPAWRRRARRRTLANSRRSRYHASGRPALPGVPPMCGGHGHPPQGGVEACMRCPPMASKPCCSISTAH